MKLIKNITWVLALLMTGKAAAQENIQLDRYLSEVYRNHIIPGFSVVVVKKGKVSYLKGFGFEQAGSSKPFTPKTICGVGSITKSMTALAVLQLADQNKIDLEAPVIKYIAWFRTANKELSDKITVRMLLNNTSGLYSNNPLSGGDTSQYAVENLVKSLSSTYLTRQPGTSYEYSNIGFSVAGLIISKVSGTSYEKYLRDNIFLPLRMVNTSTDPAELRKKHLIKGSYWGIDKPIRIDEDMNNKMHGYIPAGLMMYSNAEDMGKYISSLMAINGNKVINVRDRLAWWKPNISFPGLTKEEGGNGSDFSYGLGWMRSTIEGREILHHAGSTGSSSSFSAIDKANDVGVSIIMNMDLSFTNKFAYPTEITIINNILRIASGLKESSYGAPTIRDPTLNNYSLADEKRGRYLGNYELKSQNVVFQFAGASMKIFKDVSGQLIARISRGRQIVDEFVIDFINESAGVSRNIASPLQVRFKLSPAGNVTGIYFNGMEYIRENSESSAAYKITVSGDKSITFKVPVNWSVKWKNNEFSAYGPAGKAVIEGVLTSGSTLSPENFATYAIKSPDLVTNRGIKKTENFGTYEYEEQAFSIKLNNETKQVFALRSRLHNKELSLVLLTNEGYLTAEVQKTLTLIASSVMPTGN